MYKISFVSNGFRIETSKIGCSCFLKTPARFALKPIVAKEVLKTHYGYDTGTLSVLKTKMLNDIESN